MDARFNFKSVILVCLIVLEIQTVSAADLANGEKLHTDKCVACHAQKAVFGDADIFYLKKDRKVNDFNGVKRMVSLCNTELRLDLFPEDEQDITLFLNTRYYRFK